MYVANVAVKTPVEHSGKKELPFPKAEQKWSRISGSVISSQTVTPKVFVVSGKQ